MDGNVFSNSLYALGQYLMNNPQGTGQQQVPGGQTPQKIDTTWTYGSPGSAAIPTSIAPPPPQQVSPTPVMPAPAQANFAQPNLPGAHPAPASNAPVTPAGTAGGGGSGMRGGGGGYGAEGFDASTMPDDWAGADVAGMGGGGGGWGSGQPTQNAISGITNALSKGLSNAASTIAGVKTQPDIIQGGEIPGINQQAPTLVGRRPQTAFYG